MMTRRYEGWAIILILFIVLALSLVFKNQLASEVLSKLCAGFVLLGVYAYIWLYFKKKSDRKAFYPVKRETLIRKGVAYAFILGMTIIWSGLASLLGSGVVDYAFDIVLYSPLIVAFLVMHTYFVDRYYDEHEQRDENYQLGDLLLSKKYAELWQNKQLCLKIALKAFFIPFMYMIALGSIERLLFAPSLSWGVFIYYGFIFGIMFDVIVAFCGYLFTTKLINNQIISVEDDWKGWFFCLMCYPPLIFILPSISEMMDGNVWSDTSAPLSVIWLLISVQAVSWIVYWWSTVAFGLRFSNLTWRGLVQQGPYAWTKHPAYLSKNIYWWINVGSYLFAAHIATLEKAKILSLMMLISIFYYGRCKCEERHLLNFEPYRNYADSMSRLKWWQRLSVH